MHCLSICSQKSNDLNKSYPPNYRTQPHPTLFSNLCFIHTLSELNPHLSLGHPTNSLPSHLQLPMPHHPPLTTRPQPFQLPFGNQRLVVLAFLHHSQDILPTITFTIWQNLPNHSCFQNVNSNLTWASCQRLFWYNRSLSNFSFPYANRPCFLVSGVPQLILHGQSEFFQLFSRTHLPRAARYGGYNSGHCLNWNIYDQ